MAETLSVSDMLPNKFEPKRAHRWIFALEGIDSYLVSKAARPSVSNTDKPIPWINSTRYIAGKFTFGELAIELHDPIAPSGAQQVMEWIRTHQEMVSGRAGYADFYKRDCQLKMLDPVGTVVELWDYKGAFIKTATYNSVDYGTDDVMKIALTLKFDNCVLQF